MTLVLVLGIFSALLALIAFIANEFGLLTSDDFLYDLLNFLSAVGLCYYAFSSGALPFIITNTVWGLVSGFDVIRYAFRRATRSRRRRKYRH